MSCDSSSAVLPARGGGSCGEDGGRGPAAGQPRLTTPLLPWVTHAEAVGPLGNEEEIVITVTQASDDEVGDVELRVEERIKCGCVLEASEMSTRIAAISRSRAASREATPSHSQVVSCVPSSEEVNAGSVIINPVQEALPSHPLHHSQSQPHRKRNDAYQHWRGSSGNITSTDSTPSSDHTADSGQATDSPLSGNINSLGFPSNAGDANACQYRMPIVGYEVLEERARFTVFKIQVFHQPTEEYWFVFRRYTDFVRLNKTLRKEFPGLRFALPPKRWFGDNFDPIFLEDRQLGLQAFIDNIIGHTVIREKKCVRAFFCLDDPLGTHDTLEESRAMCQSLEETVSDLQDRLREKEGELAVLRSQVNFLMVQQKTLVKALRLECDLKSPVASDRGSTHDLNLALLNICERTLDGGISTNHGATERNGMNDISCDTSPVRRGRVSSTVESPLRRTLEKAFLPRSCSHNTLSPGCNGAAAVSGNRAAKALVVTEGDGGASR